MSLHLEHLNPEQLAAVTLPDEHGLILAGAGSTLPLFTSQAMRVVSTRVLPLPAPARISADACGSVTAASCSGLRLARRGEDTLGRLYAAAIIGRP